VEIFWLYKLVIKITNSTVLNKLQSYSRISALGLEGHYTSYFKRAMWFDVDRMWTSTNRERSGSCGQREEVENPIFVGRH